MATQTLNPIKTSGKKKKKNPKQNKTKLIKE
jgi:hypothetical protein